MSHHPDSPKRIIVGPSMIDSRMARGREGGWRLLAFLAVAACFMAVQRPAVAYIAVSAERLTLPEVMAEFKVIAVVAVDRFDPQRGAVRYRLVEALVGKLPPEASLKHSLLVGGKLQPGFAALKSGDLAILFWGSFDPRSLILTPGGWYETRTPGNGDDGWERLTQRRDDMVMAFLGSPRQLRDSIKELLTARPVTVPIRPKGDDAAARLLVGYDLIEPHRRFVGLDPQRATARSHSVEAWSADLKSAGPLPRQQAALALGELGPAASAAVPALVAALADSGIEVRAAILEALGRVGGNSAPARQALVDALKDDDRFIVAVAARALAQLGDYARPALPALAAALPDRNHDFDYRPLRAAEAARAILIIAPEAPEAKQAIQLLAGGKMLNDDRPDSYGTRTAGARALADAGPGARPAIPSLIKRLRDDNLSVRIAVAEALLLIEPDSAHRAESLDILSQALESPDLLVREQAVRAIRRTGLQAAAGRNAPENTAR